MIVMLRLGKPCAPAAEGRPSAAMPARVARRVSMGDSGESSRPELYVVAGVWSKSQEATMQDHIYKVVELVASSETSIEDASALRSAVPTRPFDICDGSRSCRRGAM